MGIQDERVWTVGQFMVAQMEIEDGVTSRIYEYGTGPADEDYGDRGIVPDFIDIHTYGAYDFDTNGGQSEGLCNWMKRIPEEGVTAILPTTVTQMPDVLTRAVVNVVAVVKKGREGAEIPGIHFEGPFLDMGYKRTQSPETTVSVSVEQFKRHQEAIGGLVEYITLAPERDSNHTLIRYCSIYGVVVSVGHSTAIYEQALLGIANGILSMIHIYNDMTPYHHRKPRLVGTAFKVRDTYGEIIYDEYHSHLVALNNSFTTEGHDHSIMISDSLRAKHCLPRGRYQLGGYDIETGEDGLARLKGTETTTGGTLNMNRGLKALAEQILVSFDAALNSYTTNPTGRLGVDHGKVRTAVRCDGDLMVLDDDYSVLQTWCRGRVMFR